MTAGLPTTSAITPAREFATVVGAFLTYGAIFFDRLAPLFVVSLIAADLGVPSAWEGTLALLIGIGWAAAMPIVRGTTGRFDDRSRVVVAAVLSATFSLLSVLAGSWLLFIVLRGFGGIAAGSGSPAITSLMFSSAPPRRRGLELGIVQSATRVIGSLIAPVVVTAVVVAAGWRAALATSAVLLLVSVLTLLMTVPGSDRRPGSTSPAEPFAWRDGGWRNVVLCTICCVVLLSWLTVWSQSAVVVVGEWLDLGPGAAGQRVGLFGVGAGVGAVVLPILSDRIGRRAAAALGAVLGGGGGLALGIYATTGIVPGPTVVATVIVLSGVAMGVLPLTISLIPAEAVASGDRARALIAPIAAGELLGAALLPAVAANVASVAGYPRVLTAFGAVVFGVAGISMLLRPSAPKAQRAEGADRG